MVSGIILDEDVNSNDEKGDIQVDLARGIGNVQTSSSEDEESSDEESKCFWPNNWAIFGTIVINKWSVEVLFTRKFQLLGILE